MDFGNGVPRCYTPKVVTDSQGNAIAVWHRQGTGFPENRTLWYSRFEVGAGWTDAQQIDTGNSSSHSPLIAMDGQGNALMGYYAPADPDGRQSFMAMRWDSQSGWGAPQAIESSAGGVGAFNIAVDAAGNGIAVYQEESGGSFPGPAYRSDIYAVRYEVGTGWSAPVLIESFDTVSRQANVALGANGDGMVIWEQSTYPGSPDIWAARFNGSDWDSPVQIDPLGGYPAGNASEDFDRGPKVRMDDEGNAIAVWVQEDEQWASQYTITSIWANRFVAGVGWGSAAALESFATAICRRPTLSVGSNGTAWVGWDQQDNIQADLEIRAVRFDGQSWTAPEVIGDGARPQAAVDEEGNAVLVWGYAVWIQGVGFVYEIRASNRSAGGEWTVQERIDRVAVGLSVLYPVVALSANGIATAVWQQYAGNNTQTIWANRRE